jgi:hypothetical protein
MSQENVEMVRYVYESGLIDRDPEKLLKLATPDIEYVNPPYAVEPGCAVGSSPSRRPCAASPNPGRNPATSSGSCTTVGTPSWPPSAGTSAAGEARGNSSMKRPTLGPCTRAGSLVSSGDLGNALEAAGVPE